MNRTALVLVAALLGITNFSIAQSPKYHILVGTYTSTGKSDGIYVYEFDDQTGALSYKSKITGISNPTYLAVSPNRKQVYSVSEDKTQAINSFNYDSKSGKLTFLNKLSTSGDSPCYVSVDASGKYVFAANYGGGSIVTFQIRQDGSIGSDSQFIKHEGSSIVKGRQSTAHAHSVVLSPDNKFLFVPDLGIDKINIYKFNPKKSAPLSPSEPASVPVTPGSGPRHITFHPKNKFAYSIHELNGMITAFSYKKGVLKEIQTAPTLPEGFKGRISGADIHVSPDGEFLYGSNRGDGNDLVIYRIDQKNGRINFVGRQASLGRTPRNFTMDPSGSFLLVANQDTDNITVFKRDKKTGLLTDTGLKVDNIGKPAFLKFVETN